VHIHLIDRLWQRDLDAAVLKEFYPSAVGALRYMQSLDQDGDGLPELDADPIPNQFYGAWPWHGLSIYVAGFWLAALGMMERMAHAYGDFTTESLCQDWSRRALQAVEKNLWSGSAYLLYRDGASGKSSDTLLANQMVGQWCSRLHSLPSLYPPEHVRHALETVLAECSQPTEWGLMNAVCPDGALDISGAPLSNGIFTGECIAAAATMAYEGLPDDGMEVARRMMEAIVLRNGAGWELPNLLNTDGKIIHGDDFYQMMIIWALPLALRGEGIREACFPAGLIDRVLKSSTKSVEDRLGR
ncbi:MAG: GH116 family glycosyl hydrolase, partial [Ginsengibacter sp.]